MKCWMKDGLLLYQHYSKPMATKLVISARSAHSDQTKRSVHIAECVRRMMNTSHKLDWDEYFVPVLTDYAERMMAAGYSQSYRKEILRNAVNMRNFRFIKPRDKIKHVTYVGSFHKGKGIEIVLELSKIFKKYFCRGNLKKLHKKP